MYSNEIKIDVTKSKVNDILGDPFCFVGIVGHINILQVFDKKQARYVTPESLSEPANDFLVLYVFGTPDTKLNVMKGYMKGPEIVPGGISYSGRTDDDKMEWKMEFSFVGDSDPTRVRVTIDFRYKSSTLDKLLGRNAFQLAEHILNGHIVPYFKFYQKDRSVKMPDSVSWDEIERVEDEIPILATKVRDMMSKIETGALVIVGKNLRCVISVKDGKPLQMKMIRGNEVVNGTEVLARLLLEQGKGIMVAYNADPDLLINALAEKALRELSLTFTQK